MGTLPFPIYGKDIGSAIEDVEKIVAKIKTNKYGKKDLITLIEANNKLLGSLLKKNEK